ncbi:MAG: carbohydrate binding domain-containing protein [Planctomycetaceae bacterium]|nr:carbohydrate binding domain-containing protein [Planctomycetaceae bacterium]
MKCAASVLLIAGLFAFADEPKNLLKPINKAESWRLEEHEGGKGLVKVMDDAVVLASTKVTGTDWHVQAIMTDLDLKEGQAYILKFKAKADASCSVGVNMGIDEEDWHQIGLGEQITIGKTLAEHEFRFTAEQVNTKKKNRLAFVVGLETCAVTIKDLTLTAK